MFGTCFLAVLSGVMAYASVRDYGVQAISGGGIPRELWIDAAEAKRLSEERQQAWKALGYEPRGTIHPGHSFSRWPELFWDSHREWFGLLPNGKRGVELEGYPSWMRKLSKMCVSNEEIVDRKISDWVAAGCPEGLSCGENDGLFGFCRCVNCRKLDADRAGEPFLANKTDRYLNFWNRVVAKARRLRPDVKVAVHLYSRYYDPPRRERVEYPDNIVFSFVAKYQDPDPVATIEAWKRAGLRHFFLRPNYLCNRSPFPIGRERFIWRIHRQMLEAGSLGDCFDSTLGIPATEFDHYTALRICVDPDLAFGQIEHDWCARYGAAAKTVEAYYARIRARCDREWPKLLAYLKAEGIEFLDDSHFSRYYYRLHTEEELQSDLDLLEGFDARMLSGSERKRFDDLKVNARHYILCRRAVGTESESDKKALVDYRIAHKASLGTPWKSYWNKGEYWLWNPDPAKAAYERTGIVKVVEAIEDGVLK